MILVDSSSCAVEPVISPVILVESFLVVRERHASAMPLNHSSLHLLPTPHSTTPARLLI